MKKSVRFLLLSLAVPLILGALAGLLTLEGLDQYAQLNRPAAAPAQRLFPLILNALYLLMGVSAWLVWKSQAPETKAGLLLYAVQLAVAFIWLLLFFTARAYLLSLLWLLLLLAAVIAMIALFYQVSKIAAWLQAPYLLWLLFAAYLNLALWLFNPGPA